MNDSERNDPLLYDHHFENFDYYTDFSETPDSLTSASQFTNNDCMMNNVTTETDNNNNVDGSLNNSSNLNCKEVHNQMTNAAADSEWLPTMVMSSCKQTPGSAVCADAKEENSNTDSNKVVGNSNEHTKKNELPSEIATTKAPAKPSANKKYTKSKKVCVQTMDRLVFPTYSSID